MTPEEKEDLFQTRKNSWHYPSWVFDESDYTWKPPKDKPTTFGFWVWDEEIIDWKDTTPPEIQLSAVSFI